MTERLPTLLLYQLPWFADDGSGRVGRKLRVADDAPVGQDGETRERHRLFLFQDLQDHDNLLPHPHLAQNTRL
jgi:hypothetical protein